MMMTMMMTIYGQSETVLHLAAAIPERQVKYDNDDYIWSAKPDKYHHYYRRYHRNHHNDPHHEGLRSLA